MYGCAIVIGPHEHQYGNKSLLGLAGDTASIPERRRIDIAPTSQGKETQVSKNDDFSLTQRS